MCSLTSVRCLDFTTFRENEVFCNDFGRMLYSYLLPNMPLAALRSTLSVILILFTARVSKKI